MRPVADNLSVKIGASAGERYSSIMDLDDTVDFPDDPLDFPQSRGHVKREPGPTLEAFVKHFAKAARHLVPLSGPKLTVCPSQTPDCTAKSIRTRQLRERHSSSRWQQSGCQQNAVFCRKCANQTPGDAIFSAKPASLTMLT